jgi:hypothetical protein
MKNIPLQIESELTRRGTSLKAVVFYATHLTLIEEIILPFDPDLFRLHQQRKFQVTLSCNHQQIYFIIKSYIHIIYTPYNHTIIKS